MRLKIVRTRQPCSNLYVSPVAFFTVQTDTYTVGKGKEVCFFLRSLGSRYGGLNPITASYLWKQIGIPKFLYGSELLKLSKTDIIELERVQNIMLRIMQGLLPGTSGSAARRLLGMLPIEVEIDNLKLCFLGRLINIGADVVSRRVLFI